MPTPSDPHDPTVSLPGGSPAPPDATASLPRVPSDLSRRLRQQHGDDVDPDLTLPNPEDDPARAETLGAPSTPSATGERYTFEGEIARGGMGAVLGVYDQDLRRRLAMKVILTGEDGSVESRTLGRFLEEAQVTAQLDHPGVVPVHELGLDGSGQVYFTMKLVKGQDLKSVFERVRDGEEGWTTTRVLNLLLRACEAVAFAHSKGVIHRDLKPANIMVGRFGEVYVMDWGIARVLGQPDRKDLRIRADLPQTSVVHSDRKDEGSRDDSPDSPLLTMDGDVVGTPAYMPLEQAEGRLEDIGPQSDVYSLGTILYELLAGQMPYVAPGARVSARTILGMVIQGPPTPVEQLAPTAPPELLAICHKAMERRREDRYATTEELAEDLRAFLEQRVVKAYRTGAIVEMRKWVQRNKGLAASLVAGLVLLVLLGGTAVVAAATKEKADQLATAVDERDAANQNLAAKNAELDGLNAALNTSNEELNWANAALGTSNAALAEANSALDDRNRLLGDLEILRDLREREQELWPARPRRLEAMDGWLDDALDWLTRAPDHERVLFELREEAAPVSDKDLARALARSARSREHEDAGVLLARLAADLAALPEHEGGTQTDTHGGSRAGKADGPDEAARAGFAPSPSDEEPTPSERRAALLGERDALLALRAEIEDAARSSVQWRFPDEPDQQWRHDNLAALVSGARSLGTPDTGLLASMEVRRDRAATIEDATIGDHFDAWMEALDAIASSEHYGGLEIPEQVGLIPLGPDPDSGLWEFWHVESGARPGWSPEEGVTPSEEMGLVLVLIPGGTFRMGASPDPSSAHHDPHFYHEGPVHEVTLAPYLLSKYELTQGQWFRLTGERPSLYSAGERWSGNDILDSNPATNVSWEDAQRVLPRFGLRLPTEAQWESACRAGSSSPWWCGGRSEIAGIRGIAGNILDQGAIDRGAPSTWDIPEPWDDGHVVHAPVGTFLANGFGLHDVLGNVWECCEDELRTDAYHLPTDTRDGHRLLLGNNADGPGNRVVRGGGFSSDALDARSACRGNLSPWDDNFEVGLRPAQGIEP